MPYTAPYTALRPARRYLELDLEQVEWVHAEHSDCAWRRTRGPGKKRICMSALCVTRRLHVLGRNWFGRRGSAYDAGRIESLGRALLPLLTTTAHTTARGLVSAFVLSFPISRLMTGFAGGRVLFAHDLYMHVLFSLPISQIWGCALGLVQPLLCNRA